MYHIYTQQLFNFQKIIFLPIPPPIQRPTTGLFVNVWLHIHHTAGMEKGGMSAILCNRSLWSHFCSSKIYMRPPWTLSNCIWRFSTLQRRYLTFGDISVRWRWVKWFSKNSFCSGKTSRFLKICFYKLQKDCPPGGQSFDTGMRMFGNEMTALLPEIALFLSLFSFLVTFIYM